MDVPLILIVSFSTWSPQIYRPTQYSHTLALAPSATASHKFRTTVSRLARVPRKYRSIFGAVVLFTLLLTVLLRSTGQSALDKEMASKRYASGLQKAFVITDTERDVSVRNSLLNGNCRLTSSVFDV